MTEEEDANCLEAEPTQLQHLCGVHNYLDPISVLEKALDSGSASHPHPFSPNMTIVLNDPTWWPIINAYRFSSYFSVAAFVGLTYDWALTFGQEVELVWKQRWSLMTVLYLSVRYLGILYAVLGILIHVPTISLTGTVSLIVYNLWNCTSVLVFTMLWVISVTRLYAMHQGSRKILILLIATLLLVDIFDVVAAVLENLHVSGEELILSGTHQCLIGSYYEEDIPLLNYISWMVSIAWEVLALSLAVWIAVKHFRELRRHSAGGIIGDCFTVLMKTHVVYFASFVAVSCINLILDFAPISSADQVSLGNETFGGLLQILEVVQMFVLGPRLILGVREFNAKLVADSDAATGMISIVFQERVHISTSSSV
ncbi:uncharacterized protein HD556DRAFT_1530658 [Suillus plorans]|uniref:DUF6533 domain-containing protein n=1 Tax=Suillus plorans TaxID=116603 RepID=A0A9P7DBB0_9AGAM|nr:uncharacterized protein HD556DRAFT_1530658 [Suillus plorans]KAG1787054.1 hypothetical protein HD556DRAFT_1530658 [Suillus plorans]